MNNGITARAAFLLLSLLTLGSTEAGDGFGNTLGLGILGAGVGGLAGGGRGAGIGAATGIGVGLLANSANNRRVYVEDRRPVRVVHHYYNAPRKRTRDQDYDDYDYDSDDEESESYADESEAPMRTRRSTAKSRRQRYAQSR